MLVISALGRRMANSSPACAPCDLVRPYLKVRLEIQLSAEAQDPNPSTSIMMIIATSQSYYIF